MMLPVGGTEPIADPTELPAQDQDTELGPVFVGSEDDVRECRGMLAYPTEECPENVGPFVGDILCCIMLFIACDDKRTLLSVSGVCKMWRFYSNYLPHWTALHWNSRLFSSNMPTGNLPIRDNTGTTRDELMTGARIRLAKQEEELRKQKCVSVGSYVLQFFSSNALIAGLIAAHWVLAWSFGISSNGLDNDYRVGAATFFAFIACLLAEAALLSLIARVISSEQLPRVLVTVALTTLTLLVPLALLGKRVNSVRFIISNGASNMTALNLPSTPCDAVFDETLRAVVNLPAPLHDRRWHFLNHNNPLAQSVSRGEYDCMHLYGMPCFALLVFNDSFLHNCGRLPMVGVDDATLLGEIISKGNSPPRFRSVMTTDYFNADPNRFMEFWYSGRNRYWKAFRTHLIHAAMPGGLPELKKQEDGLMQGRDGLMIAVFVIAGLSAAADLAWQVLRSDPQKRTDLWFNVGFVAVVLGPIIAVGFGIGCHVKGDDEDPKWLMCDSSAGIAVLCFVVAPAVFHLLFFGLCRALKALRRCCCA